MDTSVKPKTIIGRAETVTFPELGFLDVYARIDTGARTSSIWATALPDNGRLAVVFFGEGHPCYDGKIHYFDTYTRANVASSSGHIQKRFKVVVLVQVAGRSIRAKFTLADRSVQAYPVLIGRNVLSGKFIVDVMLGNAAVAAEKHRSKKLQNNPERGAEV